MRLFGPTHEDIWKMLSEDIGAKFIVKDSVFKKYEVIKEFHQWSIVLEAYDSNNRYERVYTRIYCVFLNKHGFRFKVFGEHFNNYFFNFFDMQDIKIDYSDFSDNYIVRSNSEVAIKTFLQNSTIRELINLQPDILFEIVSEEGYEVSPNVDSTLSVKIPGLIKNNEILKNLFELVGESLLEIESISNKIESLQVNNFNRFDVIKNSVKNTLLKSNSYNNLKKYITNNRNKVIYKEGNHCLHGKSKANKLRMVRKRLLNKNGNSGVSYTENSNVEIKGDSLSNYVDKE